MLNFQVREKYFMMQALEQAMIAYKQGDIPVGAVLVNKKDESIIVKTYNKVRKSNDPTAHAELIAIQAGSKLLKRDKLSDCELYVTLEPCSMCMGAASLAKIGKIYFSAHNHKYYKDNKLDPSKLHAGLLSCDSIQIMRKFFTEKR